MLKLTTYYKRINKTCFANKLPACPIKIAKLQGCYAMFTVDAPFSFDKPGLACIVINKNFNYVESDIIKLLIHEMTHYEEYLAYFKSTTKRKPRQGHTKKFFLKTAKKEIDYSFKYLIRLNKLSVHYL